MEKYLKIFSIVVAGLLLISLGFAEQPKVAGQAYEQKLSPDGKQSVFVETIKDCPYTSDTGWFPSDFDEIWSIEADGSNKKCLVKNNYSKNKDMDNYMGSFDSLYWSPDSKYIYYLCQNSSTNALLYRTNRDGSNIKKLSYAHGIDGVVGGSPKDDYYGCIVVFMKKDPEGQPNRWVTVLIDSEGGEIKEINDLDEFWKEYKKV